ncbi:MAG: outer membrane protein assembly factor BamC [Pseudomonadota bacterium]
MKLTRVATLVATALAVSACSSSPKEQASGDFGYAKAQQPGKLEIPSELDKPSDQSNYRIPVEREFEGPIGQQVNVSSPRLIRTVASGSRVLEDERQSTVYFDVVDGMNNNVVDFVWQATNNVLQRHQLQWQKNNEDSWLTEPVNSVSEFEIEDQDASFWSFSDETDYRIENSFRYKIQQDPADHRRTTALTIELTDAEQLENGSPQAIPELTRNNIEVDLLNKIISEVNRLQQQAVAGQRNQQVPLELATNKNDQPAFIMELGFDNAWPLTGLALEQIGLIVDDLNRDTGVYYVEYSEPESGFLFIGGDDYEPLDIEEGDYEVRLVEFGNDTSVTVMRDGEPVPEQWLRTIQTAFENALKEQNKR